MTRWIQSNAVAIVSALTAALFTGFMMYVAVKIDVAVLQEQNKEIIHKVDGLIVDTKTYQRDMSGLRDRVVVLETTHNKPAKAHRN